MRYKNKCLRLVLTYWANPEEIDHSWPCEAAQKAFTAEVWSIIMKELRKWESTFSYTLEDVDLEETDGPVEELHD